MKNPLTKCLLIFAVMSSIGYTGSSTEDKQGFSEQPQVGRSPEQLKFQRAVSYIFTSLFYDPDRPSERDRICRVANAIWKTAEGCSLLDELCQLTEEALDQIGSAEPVLDETPAQKMRELIDLFMQKDFASKKGLATPVS